ncbi:Chemotaxis protein histidine kinase-like protein [Hyella patelloides LEGE 07179]|uniref:histidine kinase n=1 Tax=Hyella patelloides LEGE 07179 TaxID=945734 RepID=A0A563W383_9CYAN|nr:hybrid sensor histidine kinase/response regulator [Hyella patelloides]VEP18003.1 Chemotaxis protein histidine kinase-like protein [Hyella patelloides LEGE 07179]
MVSDFRPRESYQFFLQESVELLQTLEQGLLELREDSSTQKVHNLMRTAHSIKGGAACVGLNHIKKIAHGLENIFKVLYQDDIEIDLELEGLLLEAYDRLKSPLMTEIHHGESNPHRAIADAKPILQQLEAKLNSQPKENQSAVKIPFGEEIKRSLKRLEDILTSKDKTEVLEAIKAQLTIFRGLAQLSNLDSFLKIANSTLDNLQANPQNVIVIGTEALTNLRATYEAMLTGEEIIQEAKVIPEKEVVLATKEEQVYSLMFPAAEKIDGERYSWEDTSSEETSDVRDVRLDNISHHRVDKRTLEVTDTVIASSETVETISEITEPTNKLPSLSLGIRMDTSRLELLHNLVGELVTQDNRFLLQNQQNRDTLTSLTQWFNRFKQSNQDLKLWIDKLPNDSWQSKLQHNQLSSQNPANQHLKTSLQTIMEELAQLGEGLQDLAFLDRGFDKILKKRQKTVKNLQNNLLEASMLPIGELLAQFPRMVRDVAIREGKQVKLQLQGEKTLIDKAILEKLYDPLVHLVINSITHGLELPDIRQYKNKASQGTVVISTYHQGNHTYIEIKDDGKGIDWDKIRQSVVKKNLVSAHDASKLTLNQLSEFLFDSGFSTADKVSTLAGRGMGLSAVKLQINSLKGTVKVESQLNAGTTFTIRLPLTLTIIKLLVFNIAGNLLAIPVDCLLSIVLADKQDIQTDGKKKYYEWQGQPVPICPEALLSSYRYPRTVDPSKPLSGRDWQNSYKIPLLLLSNGTNIMALRIEQILMEQDLVIKPFDKAIAAPASLIGCTVLGDGRLIPVLNSVALVDKWLGIADTNLSLPPAIAFPALPTVLIVDDSLTIRQTLSTALRKAGYRVIQSRDGLEGIEQLKQESTIQAAISDIEMPRMNGLEFLSRARQLRGTSFPVIMLTSRSSDKYRQLAHNLGATRYLTKPFVDKEVLASLEQSLYS